jgi:8-amino-7-oxononanoate synthase
VRAIASDWELFVEESLAALEERDLLRRLRPFEGVGPKLVSPEGRELLNLCSNDYLGLAGNPLLAEAAARAARERGTGATASRLIVGDDPEYERLERSLAEFKGTEAALVLGSGYAANVGVIPAVASRGDAIFSDELNHASIVDGCRLSRARVFPYRHRDAEHLGTLLRGTPAQRKLIVTDAVFSMDGDTAALGELVELRERFGAALMVDEAHSAGVFGPHGEGYAHELGLADQVDLQLGTFSKAFGGYGAYVAGREPWIRRLQNVCRSLIFSTALPPPVIGAAAAALQLVREADEARRALRRKAERFRAGLRELGLDTCGSTTQIVPVLVGEPEAALRLSGELEERGVLAVAIRPPTVAPGTARLRFSLMATHEDRDLEQALEAVAAAARSLGLIS